MPDSILSTSHVLTHSILWTLGWYYYPHFTEEKTEAQSLSNLPKVIQLIVVMKIKWDFAL